MGFIVLYQMDVKSAFLYETIDEEVYVMQPPSFEDPEFPDKVYRVEKAMYGLHQAPRAWYGTLSKYLLANGFQREFEALMHDKFKMSAMGELTFFLGLQVLQKNDGIFILQDKYVGDILKKFRYTDVRTAKTPMDKENPWGKDGPGKDVDLHLYSSDWISHVFTASKNSVPNSDYDGDNQDRKSTIGGCQFLGIRLIFWQCKNQTIVATSTTEAEYVAAASGCGQVLWIQNSNSEQRTHEFMHVYLAFASVYAWISEVKLIISQFKTGSRLWRMLKRLEEMFKRMLQTGGNDGSRGDFGIKDDANKSTDQQCGVFTTASTSFLLVYLYPTVAACCGMDSTAAVITTTTAVTPYTRRTRASRGIEETFIPVWESIQDFVPMDSKLESKRFKRPSTLLQKERAKRLKTVEGLEQQSEGNKDLKKMDIVKALIYNWKIFKDKLREVYQIFRVGQALKAYPYFEAMLKEFDRDDMVTLWKLVKDRFKEELPKSDLEKCLFWPLKVVFEPVATDGLWQFEVPIKSWSCYKSCRGH
ncbi:putative ribonuclease H-like domain-containing protein [Tanacetum coccineum]